MSNNVLYLIVNSTVPNSVNVKKLESYRALLENLVPLGNRLLKATSLIWAPDTDPSSFTPKKPVWSCWEWGRHTAPSNKQHLPTTQEIPPSSKNVPLMLARFSL